AQHSQLVNRSTSQLHFSFQLSAFALPFVMTGGETPELAIAQINGVTLHYFSTGHGEPVVFVHGGLDDYRIWGDQLARFAQHYRVINYSRRYSFPNQNNPMVSIYSAATDADDLAALIDQLELGPVHIVAHSYGAYASLFVAVQHPELVQSMILAE